MATDAIQRRRELYSKLSNHIAQMDNARLIKVLDTGAHQGGWGRTQILEIGRFKTFIKRVPITDLEYDNLFSTKNLYDLPVYYNYGVGSAGFGVFRELLTHIKTTNWVLEGAIATFPLMYHYRILPTMGTWTEMDQEQHQKYIAYWGGSESISRYILDRRTARHEAVIFLEYIPHTVGPWLSENMSKADALLADMRETIAFLRKNEIIHFDVHFHNIVTDGKRFYLTDFGLALDKGFDLTPAERAFYQRNSEYDYGELLYCLGGYLVHMCYQGSSDAVKKHLAEKYGIQDEMGWEEELLSLLVNRRGEIQADDVLNIDRKWLDSLVKYRSILILMHHFFTEIRGSHTKDTRFENAKLRKLLQEIEFLPAAVRVNGR